MSTNMKLRFSSAVEDIKNMNSSFDTAKLRICYPGRNRNGSFISKESLERAIPSMYYCPVVCNYDYHTDEIGSHDVDFVNTDDGVKMVNLTDAIGFVPKESRHYWEDVIEEDGKTHKYLCTDIVLWKRSAAYNKLVSSGITDQSMEIDISRGHNEEDGYHIEDFEFTAFCLLGSAEPCFESASLQTFSLNTMKERIENMISDYDTVNSSFRKEDDINDNSKEGGSELDKKIELITSYGLTVEELTFSIDEMSCEDLEAKLVEITTVVPEPEVPANEFSLTASQLTEGLIDALGSETVETDWGTMRRYFYFDHDVSVTEVYCYDTNDWRLYGFTYSMNGDNVVIDFESKKRKKTSIVDFDEGSAEFDYKNMFANVVSVAITNRESALEATFATEREQLTNTYNEALGQIETLNTEVNELRTYRNAQLEAERRTAEDAVFSIFEDLSGVEAFETLRENCSDMTIEDIEEKCFAIRGRQNAPKNKQTFSAKEKTPRLPVEGSKPIDQDEPYGGIFVEFPPNR